MSDADATTLNDNLTEGSASSGAAGAQRGLLRPRRLAQARSPPPPAKARPGKARKTCATIVDSQHSQSLEPTLPVTGLDNADDDNDGTGNHSDHDTGAGDESNTQDEQLTHSAGAPKEETPAQSGWVTPPTITVDDDSQSMVLASVDPDTVHFAHGRHRTRCPARMPSTPDELLRPDPPIPSETLPATMPEGDFAAWAGDMDRALG